MLCAFSAVSQALPCTDQGLQAPYLDRLNWDIPCRSFGDAPGADALSPVLRQGFAYGQHPVQTNPLQDTLQPAINSTFGLPDSSRSGQGEMFMSCLPHCKPPFNSKSMYGCRFQRHEHLKLQRLLDCVDCYVQQPAATPFLKMA